MASSATKQKNGKWRCKAYYTDEAGKYTSKSFTAETKKEAEYLARNFIMERKHNAKPENITPASKFLTFPNGITIHNWERGACKTIN